MRLIVRRIALYVVTAIVAITINFLPFPSTKGTQMYLVTGATGHVGGAVARQLHEQGHSVRALVRDPAQAASLAAGIELAVGVSPPAGAVLACDALVVRAVLARPGGALGVSAGVLVRLPVTPALPVLLGHPVPGTGRLAGLPGGVLVPPGSRRSRPLRHAPPPFGRMILI